MCASQLTSAHYLMSADVLMLHELFACLIASRLNVWAALTSALSVAEVGECGFHFETMGSPIFDRV